MGWGCHRLSNPPAGHGDQIKNPQIAKVHKKSQLIKKKDKQNPHTHSQSSQPNLAFEWCRYICGGWEQRTKAPPSPKCSHRAARGHSNGQTRKSGSRSQLGDISYYPVCLDFLFLEDKTGRASFFCDNRDTYVPNKNPPAGSKEKKNLKIQKYSSKESNLETSAHWITWW